MKIIVQNQEYTLIHAPVFSEHIIELRFAEYDNSINFSEGFLMYSGLERTEDNIENYSAYNKKWNVLTEIPHGIILTDSDEVETESSNFHIRTEEEIEAFERAQNEQAQQDAEQGQIPSEQERLDDIEAALCELAELIGG